MQEQPGAAWGPILAAAAAEAGGSPLEYVGPSAAPAGEGGPGEGADGSGPGQAPTACYATTTGAVLWAAADDPALAGELDEWLQGCAVALGLPAGSPLSQPDVPLPDDVVALAFQAEGGGAVTLWLAPAVLGATDPVPAAFPTLGAAGGGAAGGAGIDLLLEVPMVLAVELGRTERQIRDVLSLQPGSIVELDRLAGEPVDVMVNGHLIAHAEVVVVDENFGVRITDIVSPSERISRMQGRAQG